MSEERILAFCYGTLKKGYSNNRLLATSTFVREAVTEPLYRLWDVGWFPGLTEDSENGKAIQGEIWSIDEQTLRRLDMLEGTPHLYRREFLKIQGMTEPVQGYIYNQSTSRLKECSPVWNGVKE